MVRRALKRVDEWSRSDSHDRRPIRLSLVFLLGFLFSFAVVVGLAWLLAAYETADWFPWNHDPRVSQDKLFEIFRNAVTVGAALGVGITLFFSYRRQRTTEATQRITAEAQLTAAKAQETAAEALELSNKQYELECERRKDAIVAELRSRYALAAEQLGAEALTVKLAGVFALATLADDWDRQGSSADRQTCIDLLLATYRALDAEGASDPIRSAIWRSVMDRFRITNNSSRRWVESHIDFSGILHPGTKIFALRIDGLLDFSRTRTESASFVVQSIILGQHGVLSFSGAHHSGLEFRACVFDSGRLDLTDVSVEQRIVFQNCSFNGTWIVIDGAANGKNVEFIECSFTEFPNHIRERRMRKLKFVDCEVATEVMDSANDSMSPGISSVYPFDLVVRGTRYENAAPEILPISHPGDPEFLQHLSSRHSDQ